MCLGILDHTERRYSVSGWMQIGFQFSGIVGKVKVHCHENTCGKVKLHAMLPSNILMSLAVSGMLTSQLLKLCIERNVKQNLRLLLALTSTGVCSADCYVLKAYLHVMVSS